MKIIIQIARALTGLLFIFSGVVKLNDPSGFSIKLNEYFDVFAQDVSVKQDSLKFVLTQGANVVGNKTMVLYSFDSEKEFSVNTRIEPQADSTGKVLRYDAELTVKVGNDVFDPIPLTFQDSQSLTMLAAKAMVGEKTIYQKDFRIGITSQQSVSESLNVQPYVKAEGFLYDFFKSMKDYTLILSVFVCSLEVILGFALIVGWQITLTSWLILLLIVFFTFLTFYSAYFNKVTDCGCFGDFIKLKPWQSFNKDLILLVLILIVFFGKNHIKPWFSKKFGWKFMAVISVFTVVFGVWCYLFLPVWDFLPYKKGNDIAKIMRDVPAGMRSTDSIEIVWVMKKGNDSATISTAQFSDYTKKGWEYSRRIDKVVIEGYRSPIHDFAINDPATGTDLKDSFLNYNGYQLVYAVTFLEQSYKGCIPEIKEIAAWAKDAGVKMNALTATSPEPATAFSKKHGLGFDFYSSDQKMLMTIARYNPTLYLFKGSVVVKKWSGRELPSIKRLQKLTSK